MQRRPSSSSSVPSQSSPAAPHSIPYHSILGSIPGPPSIASLPFQQRPSTTPASVPASAPIPSSIQASIFTGDEGSIGDVSEFGSVVGGTLTQEQKENWVGERREFEEEFDEEFDEELAEAEEAGMDFGGLGKAARAKVQQIQVDTSDGVLEGVTSMSSSFQSSAQSGQQYMQQQQGDLAPMSTMSKGQSYRAWSPSKLSRRDLEVFGADSESEGSSSDNESSDDNSDQENKLEDLQAKAIFSLVEPIKVKLPGGSTTMDTTLLVLTNRQGEGIEFDDIDKFSQAMDISPRPKLVMNFMPSFASTCDPQVQSNFNHWSYQEGKIGIECVPEAARARRARNKERTNDDANNRRERGAAATSSQAALMLQKRAE